MAQQQAVVIGSGMGGLSTAQVLSRYFDHVVIVDRDTPQPLLQQSALDAALMEDAARPGVKQVRQLLPLRAHHNCCDMHACAAPGRPSGCSLQAVCTLQQFARCKLSMMVCMMVLLPMSALAFTAGPGLLR